MLLRVTLTSAILSAVAVSRDERQSLRSPNLLGKELWDPTTLQPEEDPGEPLFLTPYLESGNVTGGQRAAIVPPLAGRVSSYAGLLTVNATLGSNLFFWYFPAEQQHERAPVLLWLQGGPGSSSLLGLFVENGPYRVLPSLNVALRGNLSWSNRYHVLYIDNPVGTGYSFTGSAEGYATDEVEVGRDLLKAVEQFFALFPELQKREFYITGESYGAKYVAALARAIHQRKSRSKSKVRINLHGMMIGNGVFSLDGTWTWADYLYQIGLLDDHGQKEFKGEEGKVQNLIHEKKWREADLALDRLIVGLLEPEHETLFTKLTGFTSYYNLLESQEPDDRYHYVDVVQVASVRRALHVGRSEWHSGQEVRKFFEDDVAQSVSPWIAELLKHYRILIYNGQLDILVQPQQVDTYIRHMKWPGAKRWEAAFRKLWRVQGRLAGYVKSVDRLTYVVVRNAGHMAIADQPDILLDLLHRFIGKEAFS